jgi:hypothetical protein
MRCVPSAVLLFTIGIALAQDGPRRPQAESHEVPAGFEVELVASDVFRSGSYIQPLWRGLGFEGHYFGGERTDVGFAGASWTFRLSGLKLSPGGGVLFGSDRFATSPAIAFRWDYERGWLVSQGLIVQGFRRTPVFEEEASEREEAAPVPVSSVRPAISDGNHVSARRGRLTVGGTFEHIRFREGNEWKGGGRLGVRLFPRVSAVLYVLGPGRVEWRGGMLIHPRRDD